MLSSSTSIHRHAAAVTTVHPIPPRAPPPTALAPHPSLPPAWCRTASSTTFCTACAQQVLGRGSGKRENAGGAVSRSFLTASSKLSMLLSLALRERARALARPLQLRASVGGGGLGRAPTLKGSAPGRLHCRRRRGAAQ